MSETQPEGGESDTPLTDAMDRQLFDDAMERKRWPKPVQEPTQRYADLCRQLERELLTLRQSVERLTGENAGLRQDAAAVRELMNVYNLGGWTDSVGPMKRALAAESALTALRKEAAGLRVILMRYVAAYPAFRMKPIGAEGSPARIEQENLMALEESAKAALSARQQNDE